MSSKKVFYLRDVNVHPLICEGLKYLLSIASDHVLPSYEDYYEKMRCIYPIKKVRNKKIFHSLMTEPDIIKRFSSGTLDQCIQQIELLPFSQLVKIRLIQPELRQVPESLLIQQQFMQEIDHCIYKQIIDFIVYININNNNISSIKEYTKNLTYEYDPLNNIPLELQHPTSPTNIIQLLSILNKRTPIMDKAKFNLGYEIILVLGLAYRCQNELKGINQAWWRVIAEIPLNNYDISLNPIIDQSLDQNTLPIHFPPQSKSSRLNSTVSNPLPDNLNPTDSILNKNSYEISSVQSLDSSESNPSVYSKNSNFYLSQQTINNLTYTNLQSRQIHQNYTNQSLNQNHFYSVNNYINDNIYNIEQCEFEQRSNIYELNNGSFKKSCSDPFKDKEFDVYNKNINETKNDDKKGLKHSEQAKNLSDTIKLNNANLINIFININNLNITTLRPPEEIIYLFRSTNWIECQTLPIGVMKSSWISSTITGDIIEVDPSLSLTQFFRPSDAATAVREELQCRLKAYREYNEKQLSQQELNQDKNENNINKLHLTDGWKNKHLIEDILNNPSQQYNKSSDNIDILSNDYNIHSYNQNPLNNNQTIYSTVTVRESKFKEKSFNQNSIYLSNENPTIETDQLQEKVSNTIRQSLQNLPSNKTTHPDGITQLNDAILDKIMREIANSQGNTLNTFREFSLNDNPSSPTITKEENIHNTDSLFALKTIFDHNSNISTQPNNIQKEYLDKYNQNLNIDELVPKKKKNYNNLMNDTPLQIKNLPFPNIKSNIQINHNQSNQKLPYVKQSSIDTQLFDDDPLSVDQNKIDSNQKHLNENAAPPTIKNTDYLHDSIYPQDHIIPSEQSNQQQIKECNDGTLLDSKEYNMDNSTTSQTASIDSKSVKKEKPTKKKSINKEKKVKTVKKTRRSATANKSDISEKTKDIPSNPLAFTENKTNSISPLNPPPSFPPLPDIHKPIQPKQTNKPQLCLNVLKKETPLSIHRESQSNQKKLIPPLKYPNPQNSALTFQNNTHLTNALNSQRTLVMSSIQTTCGIPLKSVHSKLIDTKFVDTKLTNSKSVNPTVLSAGQVNLKRALPLPYLNHPTKLDTSNQRHLKTQMSQRNGNCINKSYHLPTQDKSITIPNLKLPIPNSSKHKIMYPAMKPTINSLHNSAKPPIYNTSPLHPQIKSVPQPKQPYTTFSNNLSKRTATAPFSQRTPYHSDISYSPIAIRRTSIDLHGSSIPGKPDGSYCNNEKQPNANISRLCVLTRPHNQYPANFAISCTSPRYSGQITQSNQRILRR